MRVLVSYSSFPHYRADVFKELDGWSSDVRFDFIGDTAGRVQSIRVLQPSDFTTFHRVRNRWFGKLLWQSGLVRRVVSRNYDAVIFDGNYGFISTWFGAILARLTRKSVYFWTIGWHKPESGLKKISRLLFYRIANVVLLYGDSAAEIGASLGFPRNRMVVIYNSSSTPVYPDVESSELDQLRSRLPEGGESVGAVIRLNPVKQLGTLIEAVAILNRRREKPLNVVLAGDAIDGEDERLWALAEDLGVKLYLPGPVYASNELAAVYERIDVTVIPTLAGLTTIQSMKHGVPVVSHNNAHAQAPEFEAIHPGVTGELYEYGNLEDLAKKIEQVLEIINSRPGDVMESCVQEVNLRWTGKAQAGRIIAAIERGA
jgi:glycosyltransferase involved in cell wall biosynthesis